MQDSGAPQGWRLKRVRIEHGEGIVPEFVPQVLKLGIVVVQNPTHFSIRDVMAARFGQSAKVQPFRSLAASGISIAIGSDGPMNPYLNIMFATTHPDNPAEAIDRKQAIDAYTHGSAFAEFAEKEKGELQVGQLADFAIPSEDILSVPAEALPALHSLLTIVGGRVVYDDGSVKRSNKKH
jgi:predicted amidohydrolase YtcJ